MSLPKSYSVATAAVFTMGVSLACASQALAVGYVDRTRALDVSVHIGTDKMIHDVSPICGFGKRI